MGCVRRLDFIEHAAHVALENVSISHNRSNFPCDACDETFIKKVIFQTHDASAHDGNQYLNTIEEDLDGVEGDPVKELTEKR